MLFALPLGVYLLPVLRREAAKDNESEQNGFLLWEPQRWEMPMNLFPLASLLDQHRCKPIIDSHGSAIRLGNRSHPVASRHSGITVSTDLNIPQLYIELEACIT